MQAKALDKAVFWAIYGIEFDSLTAARQIN
jgi:hypothetical protein